MNRKLYITFLCVGLLFLCTACVKDKLADPTDAVVAITPASTMPAGTKYYFYPADGGTALSYNAASDGSFSGELPLGTYRVLAFNADAEGVEFRNLDTFQGASAHLKEVPELSDGTLTVMGEIGDVFVLTINEVVVDGRETAYTPTPVLLTHTLTLNLDLSSITVSISEVTGILNGVYPSVQLSTGEPTTAAAAAAPVTATEASQQHLVARSGEVLRQVTRVSGDGVYQLTVHTLGIVDMSTINEPTTNQLQLTITTATGELTADVDVTAIISAATNSDGELPSGAELDVPVVDPVAPGTHSELTITPTLAMPASTVYYFYPADGGTVLTYNAASNGSFNGKLPFGTYSALAFDASAEEVEFSGLEAYATASVGLKEVPALSDASLTVMGQAGNVHVLSIDEVVVTEGEDAVYTPTPVLLTHTLTVNLELSNVIPAITGISGTLSGVYPELLISMREPSAAAVTASAANAVSFARTGSEANGIYPVHLRILGIQDLSALSGAHANRLQLTVVTADGNLTRNIDITALISAATDAEGKLPSGKELNVYVAPDPTSPGTGGEIGGWEPGNPGAGDNEAGLQ